MLIGGEVNVRFSRPRTFSRPEPDLKPVLTNVNAADQPGDCALTSSGRGRHPIFGSTGIQTIGNFLDPALPSQGWRHHSDRSRSRGGADRTGSLV